MKAIWSIALSTTSGNVKSGQARNVFDPHLHQYSDSFHVLLQVKAGEETVRPDEELNERAHMQR